MLRELLNAWENWSARDTLTRALDRAITNESRQKLDLAIAAIPAVDPLDALRDAAELIALLSGWQWQTMYAARLSGSTWDQIGASIGVTAQGARARFAEALDRQEQVREGSSDPYRHVM